MELRRGMDEISEPRIPGHGPSLGGLPGRRRVGLRRGSVHEGRWQNSDFGGGGFDDSLVLLVFGKTRQHQGEGYGAARGNGGLMTNF